MIELNWYKIGYENYNYYLTRKRICYKGKKITFSWNIKHYQETLFYFAPYIYPRENIPYTEYIRKHWK